MRTRHSTRLTSWFLLNYLSLECAGIFSPFLLYFLALPRKNKDSSRKATSGYTHKDSGDAPEKHTHTIALSHFKLKKGGVALGPSWLLKISYQEFLKSRVLVCHCRLSSLIVGTLFSAFYAPTSELCER